MSAVQQHPEALFMGIYQDWIDIRALARLDSAVCSRSPRSQFLATISLGFFHIKPLVGILDFNAAKSQRNAMLLERIVRRRIHARNWLIVDDPPPSLVMDLADNTGGSHVQSVYLNSKLLDPAEVLCSASHRCP